MGWWAKEVVGVENEHNTQRTLPDYGGNPTTKEEEDGKRLIGGSCKVCLNCKLLATY